MRWAITHRPQDLPRSEHTLVEGKTLEEVTFIGRRSYRVTQNPRVVKNDRCLFGLQNQWIFPNMVRRQEKFYNACEDDRVLECGIH